MNVEFDRSWGEPGTPGSDIDIVETCRLFAEMCQSALTWEETVRFVTVHEIFDEVHALFIGVADRLLCEAEKLPDFLSKIFMGDPTPGKYQLDLILSLPDDWNSAVDRALERAKKEISAQ